MEGDYRTYATSPNYLHDETETVFSSNRTGGYAHNHTRSVYDTYPAGILLFGAIGCAALAALGIAGNLISILALVRCKKLRNATTAFVVSLCAADLVYCSLTVPLTGLTFLERDWKHGVVLCKMTGFLRICNLMISVFSVVAIALNRYFLVVHPRMYRSVYNPRCMAVHIAFLWIFPAMFVLMPLLDIWGTVGFIPEIGNCNVDGPTRKISLVLMITLPTVLIVYCYARIYVHFKMAAEKVKENAPSRGAERRTGRFGMAKYLNFQDRKELKLLRVSMVIFGFYMCTVFPLFVAKAFKVERKVPALDVVIILFFFSSSVFNPVIYVVMSKEYRQAYRDLFATKLCC